MYSSMGGYGGMGGLSSMYGMGSGLSSMGSGYSSLRPGGGAAAGTQPGQEPQEQNLRTQYYGMLGGLNSMMQLGFAGISLTVFVQNITGIVKTSVGWLKSVISKFGRFVVHLPLVRLLPLLLAKLRLESVIKPNNPAMSNKLLYLLRLLALAGILIMVYAKKQIKSQVQKEYDEMAKEARLENQNGNEENKGNEEGGQFHQKEGYF